MVKVLEKRKTELPDPTPGTRLSSMPFHPRFLQDPEYYDNMGRDPLVQPKIWKISDPDLQSEKLKEVLEEYPSPAHRLKMMSTAARKGNESMLRTLVQNSERAHPAPDTDDDPNCVPIHEAAESGTLECMKILIEEAGVDVDAGDSIHNTALIHAAGTGDVEKVRYLLGQGANPAARRWDVLAGEMTVGRGALDLAANEGSLGIARLLLEHPFHGTTRKRKYDESNQNIVQVTPEALKLGAGSGNFELLKYLLDRGAYPLEGKDGLSKGDLLTAEEKKAIEAAAKHAAEVGDLNSLKCLLEYLCPVDQDGHLLPLDSKKLDWMNKDLVYGAHACGKINRPDKFEYLYGLDLHEWASLSLDGYDGMPLNLQRTLEISAEAGSLDMVKCLIEKYDASPSFIRKPPGCTVLWTAASNDRVEVMRYLLENHELDIHVGNGRFIVGPTALWSTITLERSEAALVLLQYGGPVDHVDKEILQVTEEMTVVLVAPPSKRNLVKLLTPEHAREVKKNSTFILLKIDEGDKEWLQKLVPRMSNDELRKNDPIGREFDEDEAKDDLSEDDIRHAMAPMPTSRERELELRADDEDETSLNFPGVASISEALNNLGP